MVHKLFDTINDSLTKSAAVQLKAQLPGGIAGNTNILRTQKAMGLVRPAQPSGGFGKSTMSAITGHDPAFAQASSGVHAYRTQKTPPATNAPAKETFWDQHGNKVLGGAAIAGAGYLGYKLLKKDDPNG